MSGPLGSQQWMYATETPPFYSYTIDNSLRFDGASKLTATPPSVSNRGKFTISCWVKRSDLGADQRLFEGWGGSTSNWTVISFDSGDSIQIQNRVSGSAVLNYVTSAKYRDTASWYHIVARFDLASTGLKVWVNGEEVTQWSASTFSTANTFFNSSSYNLNIGYYQGTATQYLSGYMADTHFVDNQALSATDFGELKSGIWVPKEYTGTYGTNGFHLDFADGTSAAALGYDAAGSNDSTPSGIATSDQMPDSPTNNFATLNPLGSVASHSEGNLRILSTASSNWCTAPATIVLPKTGLWYMEARGVSGDTHLFIMMGVAEETQAKPYAAITYPGSTATSWGVLFRPDDGNIDKYTNGSPTNIGSGVTNSTVAGIVWDADNGALYAYLDGAYVNTAYSGLDTSKDYVLQCGAFNTGVIAYNFGNDGTFGGLETGGNAGGNPDGSSGGYGDFATVVPTVGGKQAMALCTQNLPAPAFDPEQGASPQDAFNVYTDTGAGILATAQSAFTDGLFWIKDRQNAADHQLVDSVRGLTKELSTNSTAIEGTYAAPAGASVAWAWNAPTIFSNNTDGTITSSGRVNQSAGFSIVNYTVLQPNDPVGHALGEVPAVIIAKQTTLDETWILMTNLIDGSVDYLVPQSTSAKATWGTITATTFTNPYAAASSDVIAYCFAEREGFSKFGTFTGNGSTDGPFVYLGFRPAFVMVKSTGIGDWYMIDDLRDGYNPDNDYLQTNSNLSENASDTIDLLSNGFKLRATTYNASSTTYFYMAFAEQPFKFANAR